MVLELGSDGDHGVESAGQRTTYDAMIQKEDRTNVGCRVTICIGHIKRRIKEILKNMLCRMNFKSFLISQ